MRNSEPARFLPQPCHARAAEIAVREPCAGTPRGHWGRTGDTPGMVPGCPGQPGPCSHGHSCHGAAGHPTEPERNLCPENRAINESLLRETLLNFCDGVTAPAGIYKTCGCGTWGLGSVVGLAGLV